MVNTLYLFHAGLGPARVNTVWAAMAASGLKGYSIA